MAKFRQGDLVLTSTQEIIQGSKTILSAGGMGELTSLALLSGSTINEFSIDGNLTGNSDTAVPTEKAIKTYVDNQIGGTIPSGIDERIIRYNGTNLIQDSLVSLDDIGNISGINNLNVDGTATINTSLFCDDLYVSGNSIFINQGKIRSTGTDIILDVSSKVEMIANETDIFSAQGLDQRLGPQTGARVVIDNSGSPTFARVYGGNDNYLDIQESGGGGGGGTLNYYDNNTQVMNITENYARIGPTHGARFVIDNLNDPTFARIYGGDDNYLVIEQVSGGGGATFKFYENSIEVAKIDDGAIRLGHTANDYARMDYANHSFDIYNDGDKVFHTFTTEQILGVSGDSRLEVKQFNQTVDMYAGTTHFISATSTIQIFGDPIDTNITVNQSTDTVLIKGNNGTSGVFNETGAVELYYNGIKVAETTSSGITGAVWG